MDIIKIIDGDDLFDRCLISDKKCSEHEGNPCALHEHYAKIRSDINEMFSVHTIESLAAEIKSSGGTIDL